MTTKELNAAILEHRTERTYFDISQSDSYAQVTPYLLVHYKQKIESVKRLQQNLTESEKIDLEMSDEEADTQQNKLPPIMYPQQPMQYIYVHATSSIKRCGSVFGDI